MKVPWKKNTVTISRGQKSEIGTVLRTCERITWHVFRNSLFCKPALHDLQGTSERVAQRVAGAVHRAELLLPGAVRLWAAHVPREGIQIQIFHAHPCSFSSAGRFFTFRKSFRRPSNAIGASSAPAGCSNILTRWSVNLFQELSPSRAGRTGGEVLVLCLVRVKLCHQLCLAFPWLQVFHTVFFWCFPSLCPLIPRFCSHTL